MNTLTVTKGLKPKYYLKNLLWKIFVKDMLIYISNLWSEQGNGLVPYPLQIDIALGTMKLHYFKYGYKHVIERARTYNKVLMNRIAGEKEEELNMEDFMRKVKLTKEANIEAQLERELTETDLKYY